MAYQLDDLIYLMQRLRDPDQGCPWDLKQDFASIVPHTLEEAYEVADTIERQDWSHLEEELGDLLFQIVFYAQLGEEQHLFSLHSVVDRLTEKLIRRHPHVFPNGNLDATPQSPAIDADQVNRQWEQIKSQEREANNQAGHLDNIPLGLPGLTRAAKLQKRAAQVGFDWDEASQVLDKIEEEIAELRTALNAGNLVEIKDEMGDLLFAQVNLARKLAINPEQAIRSTNQKFERRFRFIETQVHTQGKSLSDCSLEELDSYWDLAKQQGL